MSRKGEKGVLSSGPKDVHMAADVQTEPTSREPICTDGARPHDIRDILSVESGLKDVQTDGVEQTVPAIREARCTEGT